MDVYSLLEPAACPTTQHHHKVERTIFTEIIQMKQDRMVPVFRCSVIESVMSQYCGFNSAGGVVRYITFREPSRVEAQDCWAASVTHKLTVGGKEFRVTTGTTISRSTFLNGNLTDSSYCETRVLELAGGGKIGGQATQITVLEEYAKVNYLTGSIMVASGITAKAADLSLRDLCGGGDLCVDPLPGGVPADPGAAVSGAYQDFLQPNQQPGGGLALMENKV